MLNYRGLKIPFVSFGNVTSDDLFCDKEQEIFDFYEANGGRYRTALDIGANIGVHSILMARQGWKVKAFEPDPIHFEHLVKNLISHGLWDDYEKQVNVCRAAVSVRRGKAQFVRVYGNTTGSHLAGDKKPYGRLKLLEVELEPIQQHLDWADFVKLDCEGHEAKLLEKVRRRDKCEFMVEVGSPESARRIYEHFRGWRGLWAQKLSWAQVLRLHDMPQHHSDGAVFIGCARPFNAG